VYLFSFGDTVSSNGILPVWGHVGVLIFNRPISNEPTKSLGIKSDTRQELLFDWSIYLPALLYEWGVFVNPQLQPVINFTKSDLCTFGWDDC
jgi:hypothetical protein